MSPLVSVIIPTKNSARTIKLTLQSIRSQTYPNIEIIVVDNYSTDPTATLAQQYSDQVYQQGPERTAQKNYGISKAHGEYLLLIDGDMQLDNMLVEDCVKQIQHSSNGAGVCIPVVDTGRSFWTQVIAFERSFYKNTSMEAARFLKKDCVEQVGGYKNIIFYEEFIVPQEIARLGYNVKLHTPYNIYHDHDDFSFMGNLKKKFYYGKSLSEYKKQSKALGFEMDSSNQTSVLHRYLLFISDTRFYTRPLLALGVLLLKTMEFGAGGTGIIYSLIKR